MDVLGRWLFFISIVWVFVCSNVWFCCIILFLVVEGVLFSSVVVLGRFGVMIVVSGSSVLCSVLMVLGVSSVWVFFEIIIVLSMMKCGV